MKPHGRAPSGRRGRAGLGAGGYCLLSGGRVSGSPAGHQAVVVSG
jgi:hypothetical protein